jgi:hypothetical protein
MMLPVDPRRITLGVLGTLGGVSLIVFAVTWVLLAKPANDPVPARPDHAAIRRELEAAARAKLESYAWVDRDRGIVRIPVARARELWLAERKAGK